MPAPAISIVLPVFNTEAYLPALLGSLSKQSETDFEIVAVDDGSTDNSFQLLQDFARTDSRLRIFRQANLGPSSARNLALSEARGRWIAFVDGDDWLSPELLATWLRQAEDQQLQVLIGNGFSFRSDPQDQPKPAFLNAQPWNEVISGRDWIVRCERNEWPHQVWLQLVRREFLDENRIRFIDGLAHEDIVWTLQLALVATRIGFLRTPLYGYRANPGSITRGQHPGRIQLRVRSYLQIVPMIAREAGCQTHDPELRAALRHEAHVQSRRCIALIRKKLSDPVQRGRLAAEAMQSGLPGPLFAGVTNLRELWLALRGVAGLMSWALHMRRATIMSKPAGPLGKP